jgi:hypothetical protein
MTPRCHAPECPGKPTVAYVTVGNGVVLCLTCFRQWTRGAKPRETTEAKP